MQQINFNEQKLLFDDSNNIKLAKNRNFALPESFYQNGYGIVEKVKDPQEAYATLEQVISHINAQRLPLFSHFASHIQLAKADLIPVCDDVVESSFQVLHLDMGQPIISKKPQ